MLEEIPTYIKDMQIVLTASLMIEAKKQTLTLRDVIQRMRLGGMANNEIETVLLNDLREGGQIFGDFRKRMKAIVRSGIEDHARKEVEQIEVEKWDWLGIVDKSICPDCLKRHNMPDHELSYWDKIGRPGTGSTICDLNCRCILVPAGSVIKEEGGLKR